MPKRLLRVVLAATLSLLVAGLWQTRSSAQEQTPTPITTCLETITVTAPLQNVAITWPAGTPVSTIAAAVTPAANLEAIWRLDNAQQKYYGYSPSPAAAAAMANDYTAVIMTLEPVWFVLRGNATLTRPDLREPDPARRQC